MAPKKAREYLHNLKIQNEKFIRGYQKKEGYLYRLFLRKKEYYKDKEPFQLKVNNKKIRRRKLREGGIDPAEDDAISAWSDLDLNEVHRREVLLTEHQAIAARLPSAGAVSIDPTYVPALKPRKNSLPQRSQVPQQDNPDFPSVSGLIETKPKKI